MFWGCIELSEASVVYLLFCRGLFLATGAFILCCTAVCLWYWQPKLAPTFASLADAAFASSSSLASDNSQAVNSVSTQNTLVSSPPRQNDQNSPFTNHARKKSVKDPSKFSGRPGANTGDRMPIKNVVSVVDGRTHLLAEHALAQEGPLTMALTEESDDAQFDRLTNT